MIAGALGGHFAIFVGGERAEGHLGPENRLEAK